MRQTKHAARLTDEKLAALLALGGRRVAPARRLTPACILLNSDQDAGRSARPKSRNTLPLLTAMTVPQRHVLRGQVAR